MILFDPAASYLESASHVGGRPLLAGPPPYALSLAVRWAQSVPGWMSSAELYWLAATAGRLGRGETWVEVGTWRGRSFAAVALSVPNGCKAVAVDHWQGSVSERQSTHRDAGQAFTDFLKLFGVLEELRPDAAFFVENQPSVDAAQLFRDGSLAAVFIDAGHDYASVKADVEAWLPKVKPGGLLLGHDGMDSQVQQALGETIGSWERGAHTIWHHRPK